MRRRTGRLPRSISTRPAPDEVVLASSFRRRALFGLRLLTIVPPFAALSIVADRFGFGFLWTYTGLLAIVGLVLVARGWLLRRQPAMILDPDGIRSRKGRLLIGWSDTGLV